MSEAADTFVQHLLRAGENANFELLARADVEQLARTVCAFLNSTGGSVLIGVRDDGTIIGVPQAERFVDDAKVQMRERLTPPAAWSFTTNDARGKSIVLVEVPRGPRPPYVWGDQILIRDGESNRAARGAEISALIEMRSRTSERWERQPALGAEMQHLDGSEILETVRSGETRFLRKMAKDPSVALEELGLSAGGQLRNSALVLFGTNPARWYPQTRMHLASFAGRTPSAFRDNRIVEGHAFHLFSAAEDFFRRHVAVASELPVKSMVRKDQPAYPFAALREAVLNAIVHRDYAAFDGGIWLSIFEDRIEIANAGSLPEGMSTTDLQRGFVSRPQNPDLAYAFFLRGLIEHWGIGTRRIIDECAAAGLPAPKWELIAGRVKLTIYSRRVDRLVRDADADLTNARQVQRQFNERQLKLVRSLREGQAIDLARYHSDFAPTVSDRQARTDLVQLVEEGYLSRLARGNQTTYVRTRKPRKS